MTLPQPDERGSVAPLMIAFVIGLLFVISAVTDVSGAYLRRQAAVSLADGAALAAADKAAAAAVYEQDDDYVHFDQATAHAAVDHYLHDVGAYNAYPGLRYGVDVTADTITVRLAVPYPLPVHVPGTPHTITVDAQSSSQMPIY